VNTINTLVTSISTTMTASQSGASYQWLDCDNAHAIIPGETNQSYTATANGNYAIEITTGSCVDTSACYSIVSVGVDEISFLNSIVIYPNPTNSFVTVAFANNNLQEIDQIVLRDGRGRMIYQSSSISQSKVQIDLSNLAKGIYFLKVDSGLKSKVYKVIRN
jgi:hypothetical protein